VLNPSSSLPLKDSSSLGCVISGMCLKEDSWSELWYDFMLPSTIIHSRFNYRTNLSDKSLFCSLSSCRFYSCLQFSSCASSSHAKLNYLVMLRNYIISVNSTLRCIPQTVNTSKMLKSIVFPSIKEVNYFDMEVHMWLLVIENKNQFRHFVLWLWQQLGHRSSSQQKSGLMRTSAALYNIIQED